MTRSPFPATERGFFVWGLLCACLALPLPAGAYHILFYYNSRGNGDGVLRCASILERAGHSVRVIDVGGRERDPGKDPWESYDQVWDMRFVDKDKTDCGTGSRRAADYFGPAWREKGEKYLGRCGRLFLAGEYYYLVDRNEGLYAFLRETGAVREGFDECPPSPRGNNATQADAFYEVRQGLGPATFFGSYVGGIPLSFLRGTSFVDTAEGWRDDRVDRSLVQGWKGDQLGGVLEGPACAKGRLFMVWDATMWEKWDEKEGGGGRDRPVWDDSAWFSWDPDPAPGREGDLVLRRAKEATRKFFPAVARWLGSGADCPCAGASPSAAPPSSSPAARVPPSLSTLSQGPPSQALGSAPAAPLPGFLDLIPSAPGTIVYRSAPVNIYLRFRDGLGQYQVDIYDRAGLWVGTVFSRRIGTEKEAWTSWDGTAPGGKSAEGDLFFAVLSKDGLALRKIALSKSVP